MGIKGIFKAGSDSDPQKYDVVVTLGKTGYAYFGKDGEGFIAKADASNLTGTNVYSSEDVVTPGQFQTQFVQNAQSVFTGADHLSAGLPGNLPASSSAADFVDYQTAKTGLNDVLGSLSSFSDREDVQLHINSLEGMIGLVDNLGAYSKDLQDKLYNNRDMDHDFKMGTYMKLSEGVPSSP